MKTYYIVQHVDERNDVFWSAHGRGILSMFNCFGIMNEKIGTCSRNSPDECEVYLRRIIHPVKPIVVRVVQI